MIVITIIEQGKMQYRPTLISNLYSHLNKHRLMSIFRDIMALLVSIYRDCIFLISPSTIIKLITQAVQYHWILDSSPYSKYYSGSMSVQ